MVNTGDYTPLKESSHCPVTVLKKEGKGGEGMVGNGSLLLVIAVTRADVRRNDLEHTFLDFQDNIVPSFDVQAFSGVFVDGNAATG